MLSLVIDYGSSVVEMVVSTSMGDYLRTGKPSWYITNYQGQLSLPSLRGRSIKYRPVRWQVTLYDPVWQVTLHSSEMGSREELYTLFKNPLLLTSMTMIR